MRGQVAGSLPRGLGRIIDLLGQIRPKVLALEGGESVHRKVLEDMFAYCMDRMEKSLADAEKSVTMEELRSLLLDRQIWDEEGQDQASKG